MDELWAYDEPHPSGGTIHITMTKAQAITWIRQVYSDSVHKLKCDALNDEEVFQEWVVVNWAYKEKEK